MEHVSHMTKQMAQGTIVRGVSSVLLMATLLTPSVLATCDALAFDRDASLRSSGLVACTMQDDQASYFRKGYDLYERKEYASAIAAFRQSIRLDPTESQAHYCLGIALKNRGDLAGALGALREAVRLQPGFHQAHNELGCMLMDDGDLARAIASFRVAIRLEPNEPDAHYNLGNALSDTGNLAGAVASYREAIRLNPVHSIVHYNLGVALSAIGDLPGTIASLREAIRLNPDAHAAHSNLGIALRSRGDAPGAIASFREAIRVRPDFHSAHYGLGNTLNASGDLQGALAAYRTAIQLKPDSDAVVRFAEVLATTGDVAAGKQAIEMGLVMVKPDDSSTQSEWGWRLAVSSDARIRDPDRAIALIKKAIVAKPSEARYWGTLGVALCQAGKYEAAIEFLTMADTLAKMTVPSRCFFLTIAYARYGNAIEAKARLKTGVDLMDSSAPKDADLLRFRADAQAAITAAESRPK